MSRTPSAWTSGDPVPRPTPAAVLVLALALPTLLAGCAGTGGGPGTTVSRSLSVPQDGSAEANLRMTGNASITYVWETEPSTNLTYDLHTHRNGSVEVLRNGTAPAGDGAFQAPRDGVYSLHWRDPDVPVRLVVTIEGDFTLESFPVG